MKILSEATNIPVEELEFDAKIRIEPMAAFMAMNRWGNEQYERGLKDGMDLKPKPIGHDYTKL